jgi:hypothetical protein
VHISKSSIYKLYESHQVKYKKNGMCYRQSLHNEDRLEVERTAFAVALAEAVVGNRRYIYVDETSLNSWVYQNRSWSVVNSRNVLPINTKRYSTTIYGAISTSLKVPTFHFHKGTNMIGFHQFLDLIVDNLRPSRAARKPLLILDLHPAHKSYLCRDSIEDNFEAMFLPAQSCQLNAIEGLWSKIKQRYRDVQQTDRLRNRTEAEFLDEVQTATEQVARQHHLGFLRSNERTVLEYL